MAGLAWHNFTSAAAGIGVALALARGLTRRPGPDGAKTLGNFWVDLVRATVYVLLPLSILFALVLVSQGVIQNLSPVPRAHHARGRQAGARARPGRVAGSDQRSSAPTAAASSTPTAPTRSRTRRRSPTSSRCC